jgi:hypothetical protein
MLLDGFDKFDELNLSLVKSMTYDLAQSSGRVRKSLVERLLSHLTPVSFTDLSTDFVDSSKSLKRGGVLAV